MTRAGPQPKLPTLLFVPGAFHGAWCWSNFVSYFQSSGISCRILEYRGIGNRTSIDSYLDQLHESICQEEDPVVVTHSMGAYVVARYAEKYPLGKVVLLAPMPTNGWPMTLLRFAFHSPKTTVRACLKADINLILEDETLVSNMFFSRIASGSLRHSLSKRLRSESTFALVYETNLRHVCRNTVRRNIAEAFVVGSEDDPLFSISSAEQLAKDLNGKFLRLKGFSHDMMLDSDWGLVAAEIYAFVTQDDYVAPIMLHGNQVNTPQRNLQHLARTLHPVEMDTQLA